MPPIVSPAEGEVAPSADARPSAEQVVRDVQQQRAHPDDATERRTPAEGEEGHDGEPAADEQGQDEGKDKKRNRISASDRIQQLNGRLKERGHTIRSKDQTISRLRAQLNELQRPLLPAGTDPESLDFNARETLRTREAVRAENANQVRQNIRAEEAAINDELEAARDERNTTFQEALQEFEARDPGVFERFAKITVTEDMAEYISGSELAPELASYLTKPANAAELRQIQALTGRSATARDVAEANRMLARIEARIEKAPTTRKHSTAPNQGTTLNGNVPPPGSKSLRELAESDTSAYVARRQAEMAKERQQGR